MKILPLWKLFSGSSVSKTLVVYRCTHPDTHSEHPPSTSPRQTPGTALVAAGRS